jgi:nitronate monooxygenase
MGSVAGADLVIAIADAGGVGTLSATGMSVSALSKLLDATTARTSGVVAANFLTDEVDLDALRLAASRVRLIDFFWSDPNPRRADIAHEVGALVSWQVGSVEEAVAAVAAGADVVVAQGVEAGGHVRSYTALLPLLAGVVDAVDVPVLAAGAIGHPRGLAAVCAAGASGARVGTAFIATRESGAHPEYKRAIVEAGLGATAISDVFRNGCPMCATSARHRVLRSCIEAVAAAPDAEVGEVVYGRTSVPLPRGSFQPPIATTTGHIDAMAMYASDAVVHVDDIRPAADVLDWLCQGADQLLTG